MKQLATTVLLLVAATAAYGQKTPQEPLVKDFDSLDRNGDGVIDREEADDENIWYHFTAIDMDRDQVLSRDEFRSYIVEEEPLLGEQLPQSELPQAYLKERAGKDQDVVTNPTLLPKIQTGFEDLDNNDDGYVSRDESRDDSIYEHFSNIDTNHDSRIGGDEYDSYLRRYGTQVASGDLVESYTR